MTTAERLKVAVLFGGRSVEHEVSVRSARAVIAALEACGHEAIPVGVTHAGGWRTGLPAERMLGDEAVDGGWSADFLLVPDPQLAGLAAPGAQGAWARLPVDVVFPLIHGSGGRTARSRGCWSWRSFPTSVPASAPRPWEWTSDCSDVCSGPRGFLSFPPSRCGARSARRMGRGWSVAS